MTYTHPQCYDERLKTLVAGMVKTSFADGKPIHVEVYGTLIDGTPAWMSIVMKPNTEMQEYFGPYDDDETPGPRNVRTADWDNEA